MNATSNLPAKLVAADVSPLHLNPRKVGADSRQLLQIKESTRPYPLLASLFLCVFALMPLGVHAATNELSTALQTGLFEEEANRNLPAAVEAYEKVAKQFDQNRALAATAIFRLGEVNRKLGKTNEAAAFYQRILREFNDQEMLAKLSEQNLTGMGRLNAGSSVQPPSLGPAGTNSGGAARLAQQLTAIEELKDSPEKQARIVQALFPDEHLKGMLAHLANLQEQEAVLKADPKTELNGHLIAVSVESRDLFYGNIASHDHKEFGLAEARAELQKQLQFISERLSFILGLQKVRSLATTDSFPTAPITAVLDEEETEIRRIQAMIQNSPDLINAPSVAGLGGDTPLVNAAARGQLRVVRFLLDNGAQVNQPTSGSGRESYLVQGTALHSGASAGHRAMVELLLQRGADVNARSKDGYTALHVAAVKGFQAVAEVLLNGKSDIDAADKGGTTPLHQAARYGHSGLVSFLITKGADVNASASDGSTPLMSAAGQGHGLIVKQLLAAKAKPDALSGQGRTALSYAAEDGHAEIVKDLVAAKADPNEGKVNLPLLGAIKAKSPGIVEALLKAGADANRVGKVTWNLRFPNGTEQGNRDGFEVTPLAEAMTYGQLDVIKLLLDYKADPNGKRVDSSPLIFSALNDAKLMKVLLDASAKPNVDDGAQRTPLFTTQNAEVTRLLLAAGANPQVVSGKLTPLQSAVLNNNLEKCRALLEGGAQVDARPKYSFTPLHMAAEALNESMVSLLIEFRADVNARNDQGLTPLDIAIAASKRPDANQASFTKVADKLRQHGGLADLPNLDRIEVTRPGSFRKTVFFKGTNNWNQFTLLDVLYNRYASSQGTDGSSSLTTQLRQIAEEQGPGVDAGSTFTSRLQKIFAAAAAGETEPIFPDLRNIAIVRPAPEAGKPARRIVVNLLTPTNTIDCAKDMPLEFGDTVEIPERLHSLQETRVGLTRSELAAIAECRKGTVSLVFGGKTTPLEVGSFPSSALIGLVLVRSEARNALFSSSDLTRVKVTRRESGNAKPAVWILDCSDPNKAPDLWLRDGDVIEVPEK